MKDPQTRASRRGGKPFRWIRIKFYIRDFLRQFPRVERLSVLVWRKSNAVIIGMRHKWTIIQNVITGRYTSLIDVNMVHRVNPAMIKYCALEEFNIERYKGCVIGGDWDKLGKRFNDLDIFTDFQSVITGQCEWIETTFYIRIAEEISKGHYLWGCRTREDLMRRCKELEALYVSIRDYGYKSQRELARMQSTFDSIVRDDEITVNIGRKGDLLFSNSAHRLCIAKYLMLESVPIVVAVRHPRWVKHVKRTGIQERIGKRRI